MSARVDVLAVIDQAAAALKYAGAKHDGVQQVIEARAAVAALIAERAALRGLIEELLDTELAELACAGSMAPVEDVLGRMQAALASAQGVQS